MQRTRGDSGTGKIYICQIRDPSLDGDGRREIYCWGVMGGQGDLARNDD